MVTVMNLRVGLRISPKQATYECALDYDLDGSKQSLHKYSLHELGIHKHRSHEHGFHGNYEQVRRIEFALDKKPLIRFYMEALAAKNGEKHWQNA